MNDLPNDTPIRADYEYLSDRVLGPVICDRDYIPIDCMIVVNRDHPDGSSVLLEKPWCVSIDCMLDALDFDPLHDLFGLKDSDAELNRALRDALMFFRNLSSPKVDACSLVVGSIKRFLKSHSNFRKYVKEVNDD